MLIVQCYLMCVLTERVQSVFANEWVFLSLKQNFSWLITRFVFTHSEINYFCVRLALNLRGRVRKEGNKK